MSQKSMNTHEQPSDNLSQQEMIATASRGHSI